MFYTSYYANKDVPPEFVKVSISRSEPSWFKVDMKIWEVTPSSWDLVELGKSGEVLLYEALYLQQLKKVDINLFLNLQKKNYVFYCWEGKGKFCHRHIFAAWLRRQGVDIVEY